MKMTDDEKKALQGDIEEFSDMILRIAVQDTKNAHDAEDIVQDVFVRLMKNPQKFDSHEHKKAWLIRVTINLCHDKFRSSWFRKTEPLEDYPIISEASDFYRLETIELIRKLPEAQRNAIYLFCFEGYSIDEISRITGRSKGSVGSDIHRARKKLKIEMEEG